MSSTHTNVTVTARGPLGGKDFSFLVHPQGGSEIYINIHHLQRAGFERRELKQGVKLVIDYLEHPDGKRATHKVHQLGKRQAAPGAAEERRRPSKSTPVALPIGTKTEGQVKFYDDRKGFGFITCDDMDYFFHTTMVADEIEDDDLIPGATFSFEVGESKGRVAAINIQKTTRAAVAA